jgi:ABC-2 type transport system permease protein
MSRHTTQARTVSAGPFFDLTQLWTFRHLLGSLITRNLTVKYQRSSIGFLWTLLNPMLMVAILAVVFQTIVRIPLPQYWTFLLSGYFVWNFLMQVLSASTYLLAEHAPLARSVYFPQEIPVLAAVLSRLIEFTLELVLILIVEAVFRHHGVPASYLVLPVIVVLQVVLAIGMVFPLASLGVFFKDLQHVLPIALTMLFYISPIFYPVHMVPPAMQHVYWANPAAHLLHAYHTVVYEGQLPSLGSLGALAGISFVTLLGGYCVFHRSKRIVPEII